MTSWFTTRKAGVQWSHVLPNRASLVCAGVIGVGMRIFLTRMDGLIGTVSVAGVGGLVLVGSMYALYVATNDSVFFERDFLKMAYGMIASREKVE